MQNETKNAMTKLERVLRAVHSNVDALVLLGQLFPHVKTTYSAEKLGRIRESARSHSKNPAVQVGPVRCIVGTAEGCDIRSCWDRLPARLARAATCPEVHHRLPRLRPWQ